MLTEFVLLTNMKSVELVFWANELGRNSWHAEAFVTKYKGADPLTIFDSVLLNVTVFMVNPSLGPAKMSI